MTRQDVDRLFELLAIFRPGDKHLEDKRLRSAWLFVLQPYAPEDVRAAVAQYFREQSWWPDVTDIAKLCPKTEETPRADPPPTTGEHWQKQLAMQECYRDLKRRRREAGVPETWERAQEAGMTAEAFFRAEDEAGLGVETCREPTLAHSGSGTREDP